MAAGQVNELIEDKEIYVIPTKTIPQAIASLLAFNSDSLPEENVQNMTTAFRQVSSGEVTYAVRNSQYGELEIAEGDILGLIEGTIKTTGRDILDVAKNVLEEMNWREKDLVTIFYGKDMAEEDVSLLTDWLSEEKPEIEVEVYSGKQPLYYYILGVE
ncbi:Dihydroxyacetone kinase family protein [Dehalobacter sp. UNSWDHB]|nr:Dihydroxyacetone kinase family protein [Dehalobacter sp. UNSWDHB]